MNKKEQFDHLLAVTGSTGFLESESFIQDIPFFICPYLAEDANEMNKMIANLIKKLKEKGITVLHINLYDVCLNLLAKEGDLEWLLEEEEQLSKAELKEELQNMLNVEEFIIPEVKTLIAVGSYNLIFVSGIGEVYPYIRAHNFLNNLQTTIKNEPMLMFFPGEYSHSLERGSVLELFGRLTDDRYYRAFDIYNINPKSLKGGF